MQDKEQCWKDNGVLGSGICEKLDEFSHCRLCPVYSESGRSLFDREISDDMIESWTKEIAEPKKKEKRNTHSFVIFKVENEWFALSTVFFVEAVHNRSIHSIPERSNNVFLGIANVDGELLLCLDSSNLFSVEKSINKEKNQKTKKTMVVIKKETDRFVLVVDEILGVFRIPKDILVKGPSTLVNAPEHLSQSVFEYDRKKIGLIDEEKLFESLKRSLSW